MTAGAGPRWTLLRVAALAAVALLGVLALRGAVSWLWPVLAAVAGAAWLAPRRPVSGPARELALLADPDGTELVAVFPDPVVVVDRRAIVTAANEPALTLLPGLRLRHPLSFALRAPQVLDTVAAVIAEGEGAESTYGGLVPTAPTFEVRIRPFGAAAGRAGAPAPTRGAAALFFRDLTAERRIEAMRVDFVANVSHELRTPLASVIGFIETLQGPARNDTAARERFLEIMHVQASRMARLIDDLLRLSRVELHAHVLPAERLDLGPVVGHMIEVMAPLARERGVAVAFDAPPEPLVILGDRDEMIRVVENLLENAIKYGGGGGRVEVALLRLDGERAQPRVVLTVRDHGPGIAPEHLPRLTERFYRVDAGESRREGGTGLGLAIVKHIVGRHRGRLLIESTPGEGTLCTVAVPEAAPTGAVI